MEGFRNICFIHTDEDSYQACYFKQFFKWIGFSYFSYVPGSMGVKCDILKKPENRGFDIVVSINQAAEQADREIAGLFAGQFISFVLPQGADKNTNINLLIEKVQEKVPKSAENGVISELLKIYKKNDMAEILYEYTNVLIKQADETLYTAVYEKYDKILKELDILGDKIDAAKGMMEYFLYAKYSCQRKMNELYDLKSWIFKYDPAQMIGQMDEIYRYDPGFYRVEYLKAKTAELDLMERVRAKQFFYNCIQKSTIEVCKSYLHYQLGKWQDAGRQIYEAEKSYECAYKCNPADIKAVFKMAVYAKKIRDKQTEIKYLQLLINRWEERCHKRHRVPLMDLEYAYKAYMLMDDASRTSIVDNKYYLVAMDILEFVKNLEKEADDTYFVKNLYGSDTMKHICRGIACRMDISCKY